MIIKNKRLFIFLSIVLVLLAIPLISMQFTEQVKWSLIDFIITGILLVVTSLIVEFTLRKVMSNKLKIVITVVLLLSLFLVWAELAVGIFGTQLGGS